MNKKLPSIWNNLKRIIIDSDFDGIMCGVLLRTVFPEAEILQSRASEIQEGKADHLINENTLLADLRHSPLAGFYFDHHESNKPSTEFIGSWKPYDSATRVVYEFFQEYADLGKFESLLEDTDKFDSGKLSLDEYNNPSEVVSLSLIINRDDTFFNLYLVEMIATHGFEAVYKHPAIQDRVQKYNSEKGKIQDYALNHSKVEDKIAFIDLSELESDLKMASYVFTSHFSDCEVVVVYKKHEDRDFVKVRFYRNNFMNRASEIDLLSSALRISPETAGGHKGACGLSYKKSELATLENMLKEDLRDKISH